MSDYKIALYANFIDRSKNKSLEVVPVMNHITLNKDIRQLCDSFDFEVTYRLDEKINLHSHDFVEFYYLLDGEKFQVSCGFIEDFTSETSSSTHKLDLSR